MNNDCPDGWSNDNLGLSLNLNNNLTHCTLHDSYPIFYYILSIANILVGLIDLFFLIQIRDNAVRLIFLALVLCCLSIGFTGVGVLINSSLVSYICFSIYIASMALLTVANFKRLVFLLNKFKLNKNSSNQMSTTSTTITPFNFTEVINTDKFIQYIQYLIYISITCTFIGYCGQGIIVNIEGSETKNIYFYQFGNVSATIFTINATAILYRCIYIFTKLIESVNKQGKNLILDKNKLDNQTNINNNKSPQNKVDKVISKLKKAQIAVLCTLPISLTWILNAYYLPVLTSFVLPFHMINNLLGLLNCTYLFLPVSIAKKYGICTSRQNNKLFGQKISTNTKSSTTDITSNAITTVAPSTKN